MFVAENLSKRYGSRVVLGPLNLAIAAGETVAVLGPSGSGKTTLLHLLGGVMPPDTGAVFIDGRNTRRLRPGRDLSSLVGVIHQGYDLVPNLAVVHNVLAGRLGSWGLARSMLSLLVPQQPEIAFEALQRVGIGDKLYQRTSTLSGGEQQRVAMARLLVQDPRAILADEPVSSVDPARAEDLVRLLVGIAQEGGRTLVASLHSAHLALTHFRRVLGLRGGQIVFDSPPEDIRPESLDALYALGGSRAPAAS